MCSHRHSQLHHFNLKLFFSLPTGCLYGKLVIMLPEEAWASVVPKSSKSHWVQSRDNQMAMDLAQLLVDCEFAELWKDDEPFDLSLTHLKKRNFSGYYLPSQDCENSGDTFKQK